MRVTEPTEDQRARVAKGVERFDAEGPDNWRDLIDVDNIEVGSIFRCPLSQVYGEYTEGMVALGVKITEASEYGFETHSFDETVQNIDYEGLSLAWKEALGGATTPV